ncbi:MAG: alpha-amylase, partial [Oscillospiraceae bacterium]|nr:alpha-amylase [Oscillospiraceae bacterium]
MAKDTRTELRNLILYSVYVRNHTEEGTFRALIPDLERIRSLGTDVIWLMPIHPIGEARRKG